jgi:hypothetical protein
VRCIIKGIEVSLCFKQRSVPPKTNIDKSIRFLTPDVAIVIAVGVNHLMNQALKNLTMVKKIS